MRQLPKLPNTQAVSLTGWSNFHHTVRQRPVPVYLTPGESSATPAALVSSLNACIEYCASNTPTPTRMCTIGARWSLSDLLDPSEVIFDPGAFNQIAVPDAHWQTESYKLRAAASGGRTPVIVQGGMQIRTLNQHLGQAGLALQVTGASDGHRMAGCIATGTHGSHVKVGAVHDTVLAVYLVTAPGRALLLQPSERSFSSELARWFQDRTTLQTSDVADDELFAAAQVALGGLGFVHSVVVETEPLYQWSGVHVARSMHDEDMLHALETHDTRVLDARPNPDYFSAIFNQYSGRSSTGCTATLMWKTRVPQGTEYKPAQLVQPLVASDMSRLLARLIPIVDGGLAADLITHVIAEQTALQYGPGPIAPEYPGVFFGPTVLPEGNGRSTEIVVDRAHVRVAVQSVLRTLEQEAGAGRHLIGGLSVRFAPKTRALLGMNIHDMNAYIELPCLNNASTGVVQRAVWRGLKEANIAFTCHWGQEHGMDQLSVREYFGDRIDRWRRARSTLLDTPKLRAVFTNPLLQRLGLE